MREQSTAAFRFVSTNWTVLTLSTLGVALLVLCSIAVHAKGVADITWFLKLVVVQIVIYLAAAWLSLRSRDPRSILVLGLIFAALFRLSIIFSTPYLSDDIYRYVWDGRVQSAGINPYRYAPTDPALEHLRDDKIYPRINHNYAPTIYPPLDEAIWFVTTCVSESVTWMKITVILFEGVAIWAVLQLLGLVGL